MYRFSSKLELYTFRGNSAKYLYFISFGILFQIFFAFFAQISFLSDSLLNMMLYYWTRKN